MSIEIKEMVVKSTITSDEKRYKAKTPSLMPDDIERIKRQIMAECRDMIRELINERRER